jgi:6,7-dimethyl-8-ribityllumazine synthase
MTIYKAPDWMYKPAKINHEWYPQIRSELLQVFKYKFNGVPFNTIKSHFVIPAPRDYVIDNCPVLMQQLKEYGLYDHFLSLAMIIVGPDDAYPVHVDTINQGLMSVGLNIPVLNCEDSYTAWYDAEILYHELFEPYIMSSKGFTTAIPCDNDTAVEIARCDASQPHWINVLKPHNAVCNHNKLRVNSSLRFDKKLFEMIADGSFEKKCSE